MVITPFHELCSRAVDMSTHVCMYVRMYEPIMIDPRLAGERKPIAAKMMRKKAQIISCRPVPTITYSEWK